MLHSWQPRLTLQASGVSGPQGPLKVPQALLSAGGQCILDTGSYPFQAGCSSGCMPCPSSLLPHAAATHLGRSQKAFLCALRRSDAPFENPAVSSSHAVRGVQMFFVCILHKNNVRPPDAPLGDHAVSNFCPVGGVQNLCFALRRPDAPLRDHASAGTPALPAVRGSHAAAGQVLPHQGVLPACPPSQVLAAPARTLPRSC